MQKGASLFYSEAENPSSDSSAVRWHAAARLASVGESVLQAACLASDEGLFAKPCVLRLREVCVRGGHVGLQLPSTHFQALIPASGGKAP